MAEMNVFMRDKIKNAVIIALIVTALLYIPVRLVYFRLYPGDRIKGELRLFIDGQEYPLDKEDITYEYEHEKTDGEINDGEISLKAGEYGQYLIILTPPQDIPPITISVLQGNWWNKESFDLSIKVDTGRGSITYEGEQSYITEYGFTKSEEISESRLLSDEELFIGLGSL